MSDDVELLRRYDLRRQLGKGGYATVYEAVERATGARVAVKAMAGSEAWERALDEADVLRELHARTPSGSERPHGARHIVGLSGVVGSALVLEYVDTGGERWRSVYPRFSHDEARRYMRRLVKAVAHSHALGIIHRDIKPDNVLYDARTGAVRLADWGLAVRHARGARHPLHGTTHHYMAPEMLLGVRRYDERVDTWGVGCVLARVLYATGSMLRGRNDADQLRRIARLVGWPALRAYAERAHAEDAERAAATHDPALRRYRRPLGWERFVDAANAHRCTADALDLLSQLLQCDPRDRLTARQALRHPYLAGSG